MQKAEAPHFLYSEPNIDYMETKKLRMRMIKDATNLSAEDMKDPQMARIFEINKSFYEQ